MGQGKNWSFEEDEYLKEAWGNVSLGSICTHLGRSEYAVLNRKHRLGLGAARDSSCDYITLNSLATALYGSHYTRGHSYETEVILPKLLKIYMIPQPKKKRRCVKLSEFWEAAEANRHLFDFSKLERYALGPEPDWVEKQRRIDERTNVVRRNPHTPWSPQEDALLKSIAAKKKYTCDELAQMFRRSEGAVVRRLTDFGMKKCLKRNPQKGYWQSELDLISKLIMQGYAYPLIAKQLDRSEKSLRGVIYQRFGSESLVKARARLLNGETLNARPRKPPRKGKKK